MDADKIKTPLGIQEDHRLHTHKKNTLVQNVDPLSFWLVVAANPSEKYKSQLGLRFPVYGKIKNVPNHQPGLKSAFKL
jgi:hypothetical protein